MVNISFCLLIVKRKKNPRRHNRLYNNILLYTNEDNIERHDSRVKHILLVYIIYYSWFGSKPRVLSCILIVLFDRLLWKKKSFTYRIRNFLRIHKRHSRASVLRWFLHVCTLCTGSPLRRLSFTYRIRFCCASQIECKLSGNVRTLFGKLSNTRVCYFLATAVFSQECRRIRMYTN